MKNKSVFRYFLTGNKIRIVAYCLLMIGFCFTLQVTTGHAENAKLPDEPRQEGPLEKRATGSGGSWLPIPIFITEPAFGYGLGLALGYIHPAKDNTEAEGVPPLLTLESNSPDRSGQKPPPTITGVAGGYTQNGTWAASVGHSASWREDTIRYMAGLAYADVNSKFYILDKPLGFNLKGFALYQDLKFRLGSSRFFLGGKLLLLETESQFNTTVGEDTEIALGDIDSNNIGVAAAAIFDGRDNVFTPNRGQFLQLDVWRYDEGLGGDYNYWNGKFKVLSFHQLHPRLVLGLRLEASGVDGLAPFYAYPWVSMRGIPALRYQGKSAGMIEAEVRWNIADRWAILGFTGKGAVGGDDPSFRTQDNIFAAGAGARYFIMRDLGLWLGVDVAQGPEDLYSYITVGQAW